MENDDIFAKINFCYLVGYPHLKLASALSVYNPLLWRLDQNTKCVKEYFGVFGYKIIMIFIRVRFEFRIFRRI